MKWTLALSWGPSGGVYCHWGYNKRVCLGRLALTVVPLEIDDLMEAYVAQAEPRTSGSDQSGEQAA